MNAPEAGGILAAAQRNGHYLEVGWRPLPLLMGRSDMDLEGVIGSVVAAAGLELVEVNFGREAGRRVLRVTVDREGGIDLDTIALTSERVARRLDLEGFAPGPYALEVSSPGIERHLKAPRHFARAAGERVRMKTARADEGRRTISATIVEAGTDDVTIATDAGVKTVAYGDIVSARTVFGWGSTKGGKR